MEFWFSKLFKEVEEVIAEWEDQAFSYEFDIAAVVKADGMYYLVTETGCSCFAPGFDPQIDYTSATLEGLREWLVAEYASNDESRHYYTDWLSTLLNGIDEKLNMVP